MNYKKPLITPCHLYYLFDHGNSGAATQRNMRFANQRGIVLIIAMIMLVIVSLLAVAGMRNAASSESISGNVRTTELATQAAEIALRHCESSAIRIALNNSGDTTSTQATYSTTMTSSNISALNASAWQNTATWDGGTSTFVFVLPNSLVGGTTTYKRAPECMVEWLTASTVPPTAFLITARGFGPEVASGTGRPQGSTVWLQSTIELN